ncbi:ig-like domain-containing protein [Trichonephila inaurata madagascariensis]|uniref:Ig-like domain-containing protein n=1 Tax=Trichonephila inaurata madagascariensis TaxID=2747483 RepID=A0A8X7C7R3_9ARAC|nr:ig-like domain-containing protein [Trichonephila inaurata madagascariensis]
MVSESNLRKLLLIDIATYPSVLDVPQLNLRLGSKLRHSNIVEDMDVYFECNIRANPWVSETGWRFEGYDLHNNVSAGIVISNQSLVLQKVNRSHRGRYSCTAINNEGQGESNHVYLRVQCKLFHTVLISNDVEQIPCVLNVQMMRFEEKLTLCD